MPQEPTDQFKSCLSLHGEAFSSQAWTPQWGPCARNGKLPVIPGRAPSAGDPKQAAGGGRYKGLLPCRHQTRSAGVVSTSPAALRPAQGAARNPPVRHFRVPNQLGGNAMRWLAPATDSTPTKPIVARCGSPPPGGPPQPRIASLQTGAAGAFQMRRPRLWRARPCWKA